MKIFLLGIVALQALPLHAVAMATGKTSVTKSREDAHRLNILHFNQPAAVSETAATKMLAASTSSDDKDDGDESDDDNKQSDDDDSQTSSGSDVKQSDDNDSHDSQKSKDPPQYAVSSDSRMKAIKQELAENLRAQSELQQTLKHLGDKVESDQEIEALGQLVANETESVAMANMLERMWKEMRMFEYPSYENHVKKELLELRREEQALEAQMTDLMSEKAEKEVKRRNALPHEQLASNVNKVADEAVEHGEAADKVAEKEADEAVDNVPNGDGAVGNDASSSMWNFWGMTRKQQLNVMEFTLVYLVAGIAIAFLYKKLLASTYEDHFLPQAPIAKISSSDFSSSIWGCFAEPKLCILGFCCPCLVWANTLARTNVLSYWKAFMAFFVLMLLHAYTMGLSSLAVCVLGVYYRSQLRQHYGLGTGKNVTVPELAKDVFQWCFCQPCAIIQEAREEKIMQAYNDTA